MSFPRFTPSSAIQDCHPATPATTATHAGCYPRKVVEVAEVAATQSRFPKARDAALGPMPAVIELVFKRCEGRVESQLIGPGFPECPACGATRYWISGGLLRCGSRACASAARFVLTSLAFHTIN